MFPAEDVREKKLLRAKELVKRGADTIVFASCIHRGTPIGFPCPFAKRMKACIVATLGDNIKMIDYTH
ncbi:MAG: CGGC domain-containing protein [Christensenellales bacterium]